MRPPISSGTVYIKDPVDIWNKEHAIGNAELAARLGSPATFDRRGTVFAYDDFEDAPLKWTASYTAGVTGTGHSVTLSDEYPHRGSGCLKMVHPNVSGEYSRALKLIGGLAQNRIGMETNITFKTTLSVKQSIVLHILTGSRLISAGIRLEQLAAGIQYLQAADPSLDASYTTFNTDFELQTDTPYPLKFVVDIENEKYIRCMFGGTEIDMSSYTPYATNATYAPSVGANAYLVSTGVTNYATYLDDFILTIEEPA